MLRHAADWALEEDFLRWLREENRFCNTLVDRIVTGCPAAQAPRLNAENGYEDALLDTAEPFGLWVIEGDEALSREWLSRSAAQGNPYARHLLDHPDQNWTTVVQSVIRLLYHMSRIFEDNCKTDAMHRGLQIDRKRRRQFRERRLALGHKPDDHENEEIRLQ